MAINLMGFVSGFAKGATQRITEEREKEETALSNRFKLAAVNKMTREKEANELKGLYAERIKNFNAAYPEAAEEEVLAAISTETSYNTLMDAYNKGRPLNLKEHLILNKDNIPEGFTTARSYLDEVIKPQVTMGDTSAQTRSVFGADVSPSEKARARAASQYGASADELESYAQSSGAVPDLPVFGSVKNTTPQKIETQIEELKMQLPDASVEDREKITSRINELVIYQNIGQDPKKLSEIADQLSVRLLNATPEEKVDLEKELSTVNARIRSNAEAQAQEKDRAKALGTGFLTYQQTLNAVLSVQVAALENQLGLDALKKGKLIETYRDEDGNEQTRVRKPNAKDLPEIQAISRKATLDYLKIMGHTKPDGTMTNYAKGILAHLLYIDPKTGKLKEEGEKQPQESVSVEGKVYYRPENFTDDQWKNYKESLGISE